MNITMKRKRPPHRKNLGKFGSGSNSLKIIIRAGSRACSIVHIHRVESAGINPLNRLALGNGNCRRVKNIARRPGSRASDSDESRRGLAEELSRCQYQKKQNPAEELDGPISSAGVFHFTGR